MNNPLYPIFLRLDNLRMLVVGAGEVGEEKLRFILKSSPNAEVTILAPWMGEDLKKLLGGFSQRDGAWTITPDDWAKTYEVSVPTASSQVGWKAGEVRYESRAFRPEDVVDYDLVIAATNLPEVNRSVHAAAKKYRRLVNVADTPDLCDFYLGSIVTRGPLKVAISTNGQSPTFAKRFRQWLEAELPAAGTAELLNDLKLFRDRLSGDFRNKVLALNKLTRSLLTQQSATKHLCPPECPLSKFTAEAVEEERQA